jgi:Ca-activated chloride channel family protein
MNFLAPGLLFGVALIPIAVIAYLLILRRRTSYAVRFTNLDLLANLAPRKPAWRRHVPPALYLAAIGALLLSLARPTLVMATPREDATVILAMDVSGSMAATDVSPTRLDAAKTAARSFLDQLPKGIRVGVVSFSDQPVTLVSPTADRASVLTAIDGLDAQSGTALGDAIVRIVNLAEAVRNNVASDAGTPSPSASPEATPAPSAGAPSANDPNAGTSLVAGILLSDGANSAGNVEPLAAARQAATFSVPIYSIALGTDAGQIPVLDHGRQAVLNVPPDPATMTSIAEITGAASFSAPTAQELQTVYSDLQSRIGYVNREQEVTAWFAGGGLLLVIVGGGLAAMWFGRLP